MENLWESVLNEMYLYMELNLNKDNSYEYSLVKPFNNYWKFIDRYNIEHCIRLMVNVNQRGLDKFGEIKLGLVDKDGDLTYDMPEHYDERSFNTHIKIVIEEIINRHDEINYYRLSPAYELRCKDGK